MTEMMMMTKVTMMTKMTMMAIMMMIIKMMIMTKMMMMTTKMTIMTKMMMMTEMMMMAIMMMMTIPIRMMMVIIPLISSIELFRGHFCLNHDDILVQKAIWLLVLFQGDYYDDFYKLVVTWWEHTVFIAAWREILFEHGEIDRASVGVVRPPGIVHVLQKIVVHTTIPKKLLYVLQNIT